MELLVERVRASLRAPFAAAWGVVSERELVLVRLRDRSGNVGWGEAAPLPGYDGTTIEVVLAAFDRCRGVLEAAAHGAPHETLAACAAVSPLPSALAAIDLALWDLEGRRLAQPVWKVLGAGPAPEVVVNATVAGPAEAARARAAGFSCVKVKVGLHDDAERLAAIRAACGDDMAIRIDANGAWSADDAVVALDELERFGIELCEEPTHGLAEIARVADSARVPVALDESAGLAGALDRPVCDAVCLKIARCGGISGLIASCQRARAAGYRVYLASALDGPLGIAAALHTATVLQPELASGLATLSLFDRPDLFPPLQGRISAPSGAGLGEGLVEWYRV